MKPTFVRQDTGAPGNTANTVGHSVARGECGEYGLLGRSLIMTLRGERRVDELKPGDRIITRDIGTATLKDIRRRRISGRVVRIKASSLGHNRPECDATLPAGQPILVRDWRAQALFGARQVLVPAGRLVDGEFVTLQANAPMTVHDLEFDSPHVLYVDGLEVASFMGTHILS